MIARSAGELAKLLSGRVLAGSDRAIVQGISIDSRTAQPGDLFVAIRGAQHDGHDFVPQAVGAGATALLVSQPVSAPSDSTVVLVGDTTRALAALAADDRARSSYRVVAITGSSGKTTTRALATAAIGAVLKTSSSTGNLNNHWGMPLSLLRIAPDSEVAVLELGMNHRGEIADLTEVAKPTVGVITNVGNAHLGNFSNESEILEAKCELIDGLADTSTGVVCGDQPQLVARARRRGVRLLRFGLGPDNDLRASEIQGGLLDGVSFGVGSTRVQLSLWGRHAVLNALAALAAGVALGCSLESMVRKLKSVVPLEGRGKLTALGQGALLVDESYNANPAAMEAVLSELAEIHWAGRRVAVLGDMRELGARAGQLHYRLGESAARHKIEALHAVGEHADAIVKGAQQHGLRQCHTYPDASTAANALPARIEAQDLVVIKASRGTRLDLVRDAILAASAVGDLP
jgi:UDP-N-acetylmuramoyl-tripeptide--D-alanyl-D-alanine ligase